MSEKERNVYSAMYSESDFFVVGIGASAGGLNALEEFFEQMPIDSGAAFVVVQHLSPDFKSLMKELLERRTNMPIHLVTEGMKLQPNSIYLIPPGKNLVLEGYSLHLLKQKRGRVTSLNLPINILFESLAKNCGQKAVGIVLSGTGSDGAKGLEAIDKVGGSTLVQDPVTAEFDGMPVQAIATGIVEQILSPRKLALAVYQLTRLNTLSIDDKVDSLDLCKSPNLEQIIEIIAQNEQTDFSNYKISTLSRRIHRRYLMTGCTSLDEFIELLKTSAEERSILRQDLLISVTQFFRDREAWNCLKTKIIPKLITQAQDGGELRCWVAACATGEEAYSLAMLLDEAIADSQKQIRLKIFATDLDRIALAKATEGIYPDTIADSLSQEHLEKYFIRKDDKLQVVRKLKEKILFAPHDLTKDVGFTKMNLVSCRNVLIYLQSKLQQQVLRNLHFSLASKGILFLGEAENLAQLTSEFTVLDRKAKIYRKKRDIRLSGSLKSVEFPHPIRSNERKRASAKNYLEPMLEKAFSNFLNKYRATCFLVDREHQLFHTFNDGIDVLKIPLGKTTTDITKLVVPDLQLPLVTALHRAKAERSPISSHGIKVQGNSSHYLQLEVVYNDDRLSDDFFCITVQQEESALQPVPERFNADVEANQRILKLEHELQQTRHNLQAVIEELEATNEEHQATNEELIASNEELQSANEELHSVNEELYTVNTEYQSKIEELTELNNDIDNLLRSTDIGVVFLDRELKIRKFTPAAMVAINLVEADINRPLEHITHNLDCQNLIELLKSVIENREVLNREVKLVKNNFDLSMRVHPYLLEDGSLDGLVISFIDINELKTIQTQINSVNQDLQKSQLQLRQLNQELETRVIERTAALHKSEARLRAILETTSSVIYLKDVRGHYLLANHQYLKLLGKKEEDVLGKSDRDLFPQEMADKFTANDRSVRVARSVLQFEESALMGDSLHTYISTKAPLIDERGEVYAVCGISTDISQQKHTEAELRESAAREKTILKIVSKMRGTLNLDEIFQTTTEELRSTLKCDRLVIYRFNSDWSGKFVTESVGEGWIRLIENELQIMWRDTYLQTTQGGRYKKHETFVVNDVAKANFDECHQELYEQIQAKAFCIAPVFQGDRLWGLLAAYQNQNPRHWKEGEISLLTQTGIQLGISLAQVDLFTQIQKQTKQLQQAKEAAETANHAKSVFIAHTSHELRTPLNAILGFARILQNQPDNNPAQSRAIEAIGQSGQHLLTLINDILHLAKIEAGKLTLELRDFILPSFLNNLTDIIRIRCQQKEIEFEYKMLSALPTIVKGDETRLRQLLFNLLSNAIKFTDRGKVEFTVGYVDDFSKDSTLSSNKIRFQIKDTGCGIAKTEYQDIFSPFYQLDLHRGDREGTGLGLTISRNLAEQMGSQIQVESIVGKGSVFWFDLDFSVVEAVGEASIIKNVKLDITGYTGSNKRILIVDNSNYEQFTELLTPLGFEAIEAESEAEAIARSEQNRPDLVFLSSSILVDGSDVIRRLRQTGLNNLPVIVLCELNNTKDFQDDYSEASGFLTQPIYIEQLLRTIEQHLNLTWITTDGTKQLLPSDRFEFLNNTEDVSIEILTVEQLTQLLDLTTQGDIRGTISYATTLEERSQLKPFTQKIIQLAENCQLRKLKQLLQQHLDARQNIEFTRASK